MTGKRKNGLQQKAFALVEQANKIKVWTTESAEEAGVILNRIKAARDWWQGLCRPKIDAYKAQHTASLDMMRTLDDPLAKAEDYLKNGLKVFLLRVRQEQDRAQRQAEEAARKQAEIERARTVKKLEVNGQSAEAKRVERQPLIVAPVVVSVEKPSLNRINLTERWGFRVVDAALIPREWLLPDMVKIGKVVRALKGETRISGIETYCETGVSAGAS